MQEPLDTRTLSPRTPRTQPTGRPEPTGDGRTPYDTMGFKDLTARALQLNASDIHLAVGEPPRFRIRGEIELFNLPVVTEETFQRWLGEILGPEQRQRFEQEQEYDTAVFYPDLVRCRINIFMALMGPAMVVRLIPLVAKGIDELGLPAKLKDIAEQPKGLILVTGPTGSGKSTTLAAMIRYLNENHKKNIISIEDPIEYVHQSQKCSIRQREVGIHTHSFERALRSVLREDPDIIMIGEMRDRLTVEIALKAAQTGHLVFGTLHTNSSVATIDRLLNIYTPSEQEPMRHQMAESLVAIVSQMLVPSNDGGRRAVLEVFINTVTARDYIDRGIYDELAQLIPNCGYEGMQTMNQVLFNLVKEGTVSPEVAEKYSPVPNEMAQLLRGKVSNAEEATRDESRRGGRDSGYSSFSRPKR
ncbi:type IV pilus twitching motility protein PilT [Candidatus Cyanaurora vandensis]|uniref:type IV pilus twitching motility protein PilT n=1 Tax=Candidatus Cyanaurora vandensis TaxID=2714958 RepID=UPI00257EF1C6|nr:type IV pilus twitching motility protein PilT [Candidatus Cyanaurora vandensis]